MKKRAISLALAVIMAFGLAVPGFAAGPTFTDVPETYWGYENIETAAKNGYMDGVGGGLFSPETKVTVAQFLTLLGRLVFPEVVVSKTDTWYGPYVAKAQETGLLNGSQVDVNNLTAEITRYDMAVILRAAAKKLGVAEKAAQQSQVTDYGIIPNMYTESVLAVYGMGLINGDEKNSFNGANTMKRAEVAAVIMRLSKARPSGNTNPGNTTTEPTKDDDWEYASTRNLVPNPYDPDEVEIKEGEDIRIYTDFMTPDAWGDRGHVYLHVGDTLQLTIDRLPAGYNYTKADVKWSSSDESVAMVDENGLVTVVGEGAAWIRAEVPVIYYKNEWTRSTSRITVYCEGT